MTETHLPLLWRASQKRIEASNLNQFRIAVNQKYNLDLVTYEDIHRFSVDRLTDFWATVWDFAGIRHHRKYDQILKNPDAKPGAIPRFFEGAMLNLAENILFPLHPKNVDFCSTSAPRAWPPSHTIAVYEYSEAQVARNGAFPIMSGAVSWGQLRKRVARLSTAFRKNGLKAGDRIASVSANTSHPIVAFMASLAIGAVFSALPTDAGEESIYARLSQIQPRLILTDDIAYYNGKKVNIVDRVARVADRLLQNRKVEQAATFQVVCLINTVAVSADDLPSFHWKGKVARCCTFSEYMKNAECSPDYDLPLLFDPMPFNHPALIVFSSGTTGEPKSICHSAGGILINCKKETLLHFDLGPNDTFLQITTCGWIMWLFQVSNLMAATSIVTYSGSPMFPSPLTIPLLISNHKDRNGITGLGCSPRLISEIEKCCDQEKIKHASEKVDLHSLKYVTSTGSPLTLTNAKFFYERFAPKHVQLVSISGGTDLAGCLVASAVNVPVQGHLIGAKCLGMDIRILDPLSGEDVEKTGQSGELMTAKPFPTQPLYFWGAPEDKAMLEERYMDSYYRRFTNGAAAGYWAQGDLISKHLTSDAFEILGRSDGVLNPSGVRFGSAEIYNVVESGRFPSVSDSIIVGQRRPGKDEDERVLLFIKCKEGVTLSDQNKLDIAEGIREAHSARHVPAYIFQVRDIPVTANGKKTELAVKAIVCGNVAFKPSSATANPASLDEFRQYADIERVVDNMHRSKGTAISKL